MCLRSLIGELSHGLGHQPPLAVGVCVSYKQTSTAVQCVLALHGGSIPMDSTRKQARIAGVLCTLVAITATIGLVYVPN